MLAVLAYVLMFAAAFSFGLSALIAVAIAYARKSSAGPLALGHFRFQIRIFWVGLVLALVSMTAAVFGLSVLYGDVVAAMRAHVSVSDAFAASGGSGLIALVVSAVFWLAAAAWLVTTAVFGCVRIASGRPVGG
jgi:uncharacterized membrane protein